MAFLSVLKEAMKSLRNKLLVKVLEKQDELAVKVEGLTTTALGVLSDKLSEVQQRVEEAGAAAARKQDVAELKTEIKALLTADAEKTRVSLAKTQAELESTVEAAGAAAVRKQDVAELKAEIKALLTADAGKLPCVSLKAEKGLLNYLRLLKGLCKQYTIIIAVKDTTGAYLSDEVAAEMKALGFAVDLSFEKGLKKQYHHTYIGVLDCGEVVCETLSEQKGQSYYTATRDGISYKVVSKSYVGAFAIIEIDGIDYATNRRGLNIVVFDAATRTVIDAVCFDTQVAAYTCSRLEEIVDILQRKMSAFAVCGYTIPQYCIDNKIANVIVYSEQEYWNIAENICISFLLNSKVKVSAYCASKPFRRKPIGSEWTFQNINFVNINGAGLDPRDTVLVIHPNPQMEIIKRFEAGGLRVITLEQIATWMHNYIFEGVRAYIDYAAKHSDVKIVCYNLPFFPTKDWSAGEREIKEKGLTIEKILNALKNGERITHAFDNFPYTNEELIELFTIGDTVYNPDGELIYKDRKSRLVNYADKRRVTTDQPCQRKRTIFILGPCYGAGVYAPDDKTIWSYLQRRFNEDAAELGIVVENYAVNAWGNCSAGCKKLWYIPAKPNDIILTHIWMPEYFPSINLRDLFQRPHNYGELFIDTYRHYNENGFRAIADALFKFLQEHSFFETDSPPPPQNVLPLPVIAPPPMFGIPQDSLSPITTPPLRTAYAAELAAYKGLLAKTRTETIGRIGAIVMNCNPFTRGHRYLVQYAAGRVKHLYVFAVEEDKSIFPFADRLELIKRGVADLSNVTVLPSGKFIISSLTFVDYFNKSEIQDRVIDPTEDVRLFCEEIAPALGVDVRFAGEEPLDAVTRQYNEAMRRVLPEYGIAFEEVPRAEAEGEVISASRVRELLGSGTFAEIVWRLEQLVPRTTLDYLEKIYKNVADDMT
ncbi:MAG: hypothetical protein LBG05_03090 [Treponema sp.]|jgi:[citrate (pro-3S)-lyase] ligase|nr:hypothetical protein [Treponema sp.]